MVKAPVAKRRIDGLAGALLFAVVSWAVAFGHVAENSWFGSGDLRPFAFWCVLPVVVLFPLLTWYARKLASTHGAVALTVSAIAGVLFGYGWTLLVARIMGGWIGSFSFPVALCWIAGGTASFVSVAMLRRPHLWIAGLVLAAMLPVGLRIGSAWAFPQPPDAIILFAPGTTNDQVNHVWNEVLSTPHESGRGTWPLEGIKSLAASGDGTRPGIRVSFHRGVREARRTAILSTVPDLGFVEQIVDRDPPTREDVERFMKSLPEAPDP